MRARTPGPVCGLEWLVVKPARHRSRCRAACIAAFLALALALSSAAEEPPLPERPALERAQALLEEGRLYPAEKAAREAVEADPDSAAAQQLLGDVLTRRRRLEPALAAYEKAFALDPSRPGLARALGTARFEQGDRAGAIVPLSRAVAASPDDAVVRVRLGLCQLEVGDPQAAVTQFERASDDPVLGQLAVYNLGLAQLRAGRPEESRAALERAVAMNPESVTGQAAARVLANPTEEEGGPDQPEPGGGEWGVEWELELAAGLLYDDNVIVQELDVATEQDDGAGRFEASAGAGFPVKDWFDLDVGYGFSQTLYFDATNLDLQSHVLHATTSRKLGEVDTTLSYAYSLSFLDEDRFLDFHQVYASTGIMAGEWWYLAPNAAYRAKRFDQSRDSGRDANTGAVGLLQLIALKDWRRYVTLGVDVELENADGNRYDYWGPTATAGLRSPIPLPGLDRDLELDARYRFRWRDYTNDDPRIGEERHDLINQLRLRLDFPIGRGFSLRTEYLFEDADSNLSSADYRSNTVQALLRWEL